MHHYKLFIIYTLLLLSIANLKLFKVFTLFHYTCILKILLLLITISRMHLSAIIYCTYIIDTYTA